MPTTTRTLSTIRCIMPLRAVQQATEEEGGGVWLPVLPTGEWDTSRQWWMFGIDQVRLTSADFDEMIRNWEARITGIDLNVNEEHRGGPAFGWIEGLRNDGSLLWARAELTDLGDDAIGKKRYRYCSAEFNPIGYPYIARSGQKYGNVLRGLAFTNDPYFTEMPAVARSTGDGVLLAAAVTTPPKEAGAMTIAALKARLTALLTGRGASLPEPRIDEIAAAAAALPDDAAQEAHLQAAIPAAAPTPPATLEAANAEIVSLRAQVAARDAALAGSRQQGEDLATRIGSLEADRARDAVRTRVAAMRFGTLGDRAIASAHIDKLVEVAMALPADKREAYLADLQETFNKGLVPLGEVGSAAGTAAPQTGLDPKQQAVNAQMGVTDEIYNKWAAKYPAAFAPR